MADDPPRPERRRVLEMAVLVGSAAYAAALAVPAAGFVVGSADAGGTGGPRWIRVARLADVEVGAPRRFAVVGDARDAFTVTRDQVQGSVWLWREGDAVKALSVTCPHLGCAIDLSADGKAFGCPCHASRFSLAGAVESGPSPRGMDPLPARIAGEFVEVEFRRFRTGVAGREEIA